MDTVDIEEEELEAVRKARVKQLEEMVLQLERENKKLLNKVTESADKYKEEASSVKERRSERLQHATSLDELISLDGDITNANDDEWLFVSPAKPPTPSQKQVTPSQWLAKCGVTEMTGEDTPFSLDDVRKDLSFQISNAESMSPSNMKKSIGRGGGGGTVSPLTSRRQLSNPTAQKYLNQVRGRRTSPPVEAVTPPSTRRLYQPHNTTTGASAGEEDVIPIVKWKKPVLPQDSPSPTPEETIPVVRWKKPVLPTEQPSPPPEDEFVPVVRWKRPVVPQTTPPKSPQDEEEQTVPIVRWRRPVIPQDEPQPPEPVPVVQWRRPVVPNDDIHTNNSEDVPNVTWKPPRGYKNTPIKAIATTRSPPEGEEDNIEYRQGQSNTLPRPSSRRPVGARGGLRPPGKTGLSSPTSPQYRPRNASAERPVANSLRSRSPSPSSGHYQPIRVGSRSPSPGTHHEHRSPHTSPMATRLSPRRNPQQNTSSLQPPVTLVKSPSAPGSKHLSPGGPPRGREISGTISAPSTGQRVASSPGFRQPPPLTGLQTMTTPPRTARAAPRGHSSPQRGGLSQTTPPYNDPGSLIRPARYSVAAAPQSRQKNKHSSPQRQEVRVQDEDWLEGCY